MSALAELEKIVAQLDDRELAILEFFIRSRRANASAPKNQSPLDLPPLALGRVIRPLSPGENLAEDMFEPTAKNTPLPI